MRVGLVVPGGIDPSGTRRVIPALVWLLERLSARHEVDVFVLFHSPNPRSYELAGARVHDLGLLRERRVPGLGFLRAARVLLREVREAGELHLLHAFWAGTPGYAAGRAARALGVPLLLSLGGGELAAIPSLGYGGALTWRGRWPVTRSLKLATTVTAASGPMCRLAARYGVDAIPLPLGPDTRLFDGPAAADGPPWRLLHVSDLNPVKDQTTLLKAFARVKSELPGTTLDVCGADTMDGAMSRLCADLGLSESVAFHGFLPTEELVPRIHAAHLLVHTARHEAGPLVVLEAAVASVPTVGTAVGHVVDLAPEGAVAVPVGDDAALARAILATLRDPDARRRLGRNARAWALANDADATARRFADLYEGLVRS